MTTPRPEDTTLKASVAPGGPSRRRKKLERQHAHAIAERDRILDRLARLGELLDETRR